MTRRNLRCAVERVLNTIAAGHTEYLADKTDDELWRIAENLTAGSADGLPMRAVQLLALNTLLGELVKRIDVRELESE